MTGKCTGYMDQDYNDVLEGIMGRSSMKGCTVGTEWDI